METEGDRPSDAQPIDYDVPVPTAKPTEEPRPSADDDQSCGDGETLPTRPTPPTSGDTFQSLPSLNDTDDDHPSSSDPQSSSSSSSSSSFSPLVSFDDLSDIFKLNSSFQPDQQKVMIWIHRQMQLGRTAAECLRHYFTDKDYETDPDTLEQINHIVHTCTDQEIWNILVERIRDPPRRKLLKTVRYFRDVAALVQKCSKILVLTGAGVSVPCGIPDFRSRDGLYATLRQEYPELDDPQLIFDIRYFMYDPRPFYKMAHKIFPGQFEPSSTHKFIRWLEVQKKLLRNYTQNIDTLEQVAGIENVIECHGSFRTASCTRCSFRQQADEIRAEIMRQHIPMCPKCNPVRAAEAALAGSGDENHVDNINPDGLVQLGIMKPDIVFFGESLPELFHQTIGRDMAECDMLIVIGSTLKVCPVALIPCSLPPHVPQILMNRENLRDMEFDVELLGDSDEVINQLYHLINTESSKKLAFKTPLKETIKLCKLRATPYPRSPFGYYTATVSGTDTLSPLELAGESSSDTTPSDATPAVSCSSTTSTSTTATQTLSTDAPPPPTTTTTVCPSNEDEASATRLTLAQDQQKSASNQNGEANGADNDDTSSSSSKHDSAMAPKQHADAREQREAERSDISLSSFIKMQTTDEHRVYCLLNNTFYRHKKRVYVFPYADVSLDSKRSAIESPESAEESASEDTSDAETFVSDNESTVDDAELDEQQQQQQCVERNEMEVVVEEDFAKRDLQSDAVTGGTSESAGFTEPTTPVTSTVHANAAPPARSPPPKRLTDASDPIECPVPDKRTKVP